jgi:hypothetical protein
VNFKHGSLRFSSRAELCRAFQIAPEAQILLTGVDHDARIEPWWTLGEARLPLIKGIALLGIQVVSTPNYSLLLDSPRPDDLYSIKRIAITFAEFQEGGLACALHPNGRTHRDFDRWAHFIRARPEVEILSYEFITGPGQKVRRQFHLDRLAEVANIAGRPLSIIVRGDPNVIPFLHKYYSAVIYIDTTAFIKSQKRHAAKRTTSHTIEWDRQPTAIGEPLDALLERNHAEQLAFLKRNFYDRYQVLPLAA